VECGQRSLEPISGMVRIQMHHPIHPLRRSTTIASATCSVFTSTGGWSFSSVHAAHRATSGVLARYSIITLTPVSQHANRASPGRFPCRHARSIRNTPSAIAAISTHDGMKSIDHQRVATRFIRVSPRTHLSHASAAASAAC
jgi:hypothetical protein